VSHAFSWNSLSAYNHMCFSCIIWLISVQQTCWRLGAYRKLFEKICGNEPIVTHLLSLTFFLLAQTSHGMWPLSSSVSVSFFPACLRLAAACGSFPGPAGMSRDVSGGLSPDSDLSRTPKPARKKKTTDDPQPHKPIHKSHYDIILNR